MPDVILHHYPFSLFSQKIRSLLGYTGLKWISVTAPETMPRPFLTPLSGGYRRIPVMQYGADIYCDTRIIARKLAELSGHGELFPVENEAEVMAVAEWADSELVFSALMETMRLRYAGNLLKHFSLLQLPKFFYDRYKLMKGAKIPELSPPEGQEKMQRFLPQLNAELTGDFRFGTTPTIADFCLYHPLWLINDLVGVDDVARHENISNWMMRIKAFGDGNCTNLSGAEALAIAKRETPAVLGESSYDRELLGKLVALTPDDYGVVPVYGVLRYADAYERVLEIENPEAGQVYVHFPRAGFDISTA